MVAIIDYEIKKVSKFIILKREICIRSKKRINTFKWDERVKE